MKYKIISHAFVLSFLIALSTALAASTDADKAKATIMDSASLSNGELIYRKGMIDDNSNIPFTAGPDWLHLDNGGCAVCHGPKGLGKISHEGCITSTPPIAYRFLAKRGYAILPVTKDSKPIKGLHAIKQAVQFGTTPDNTELDYCMPRWRLADKDLVDLTAYLISLDSVPDSTRK